MAVKICPSCGTSNVEGAAFCTECGTALPEEAAAPVTAAETEQPSAPEMPPAAPFAGPREESVFAARPEFNEAEPAAAEIKKEEAPPEKEAAAQAYAPPPRPVVPVVPVRPAEPPVPPLSPAALEKQRKANQPMTTWGTVLSMVAMSIPVIGLIFMIVWACGGCRKIGRRNLARAYIILLIIGIVIFVVAALLLRFVFTDELTRFVEHILPGYTIQWG